ncbi:MAG: helix-turn-helix domain-containing protein [Mycobacteriales bacterium]
MTQRHTPRDGRSSGRPIAPDPDRDLILDATSLRALSHPVRLRLLGRLRESGPSTATRLATLMGLNTGATSYHLRQLAAYGMVVEDTERGSARERWWKAANRNTFFDPAAATDPEERELGAAYLHGVATAYAHSLQRAVEDFPGLPEPWRQVHTMSDYFLYLTPERTAALNEQLLAVIARYADPDMTTENRPAGTELVKFQYALLPTLVDDVTSAAGDEAGAEDGDGAAG